MANHHVELCFSLCVFTSLSVIFFESEGLDVFRWIENRFLFFSYEIIYKYILESATMIQRLSTMIVDIAFKGFSNLLVALITIKDVVCPDEFIISASKWLYHNSTQIILYGAILYFVYNIHKESGINTRLMKEFRVVSNMIGHKGWQIDTHSHEMIALKTRLHKNENERIPSILNKLQALHDLKVKRQNIQNKMNSEMNVLKPKMEEQTRKLTIINQKLYGYSTEDNEITRKIRAVGWTAAKRFENVKETLHSRIEETRGVLNDTSRLLDIKGLPLKINYDLEYGF